MRAILCLLFSLVLFPSTSFALTATVPGFGSGNTEAEAREWAIRSAERNCRSFGGVPHNTRVESCTHFFQTSTTHPAEWECSSRTTCIYPDGTSYPYPEHYNTFDGHDDFIEDWEPADPFDGGSYDKPGHQLEFGN